MHEEIHALMADNISADVEDFQYIRASNTLVLDMAGTCTAVELADLYEELANLQLYVA
jgi:hypothetical protein